MSQEPSLAHDNKSSTTAGRTNLSTLLIAGMLIVCFACIGILSLSVISLSSKVNKVEKSMLLTRNELITMANTLSRVKSLAENADNFAHSHNDFSDIRLKTNISKINDPLNKVLSLNGVTFLWNTTKYPELELNNKPQVGFIAQELEQVYPELVSTDENGYKMVDYVKLTPVLVEAIKQQQLMISDLQRQIDVLEQSK